MIETWGKNRRSLRNKDSKLDILTKVAKLYDTKSLEISTLPNKELKKLLNPEPAQINSVNSKLKKDYIQELSKAFPSVQGFERAPLNGLRELTNAVKKRNSDRRNNNTTI